MIILLEAMILLCAVVMQRIGSGFSPSTEMLVGSAPEAVISSSTSSTVSVSSAKGEEEANLRATYDPVIRSVNTDVLQQVCVGIKMQPGEETQCTVGYIFPVES